MSSDIRPEDVASRSFRHSLRGYDPREVRDYLESVSDQLRRVRTQYLAAREQLGEIEDHELEAQIETATSDINEVLHAARVAALQMRDRAAEEAGDLRSGVETSAAATRASADADGYALRKSAWDTCTEMLEQVKQEVARLRKQSDRDSLAIVGEAERDAHKKIATARRDAESEVRSARHDAERIMVEARGERDEMMEHAARATESAQERTRALERRREVLMTELEDLRLEREAPPDPPGRGVTEAVRLIPSGDATSGAPTPFMDPKGEWDDDDARIVSAPLQHAPWADGSDTVRLVESPEEPSDDLDVDADELAGEVARMRASARSDSDPPDEPAAEDPGRGESAASDTAEPPHGGPTTEQDLAKAWSATESRPQESGDDLGMLFRELRIDEPATDGATRPLPVAVDAAAPEDEVSEDTPLEALLPAEVVTPFELRDRVLLPITNRALRDVKRQLADVQNIQLDALKGDPSNWQPDRADLESRLAQELTVLQREAYVAGHHSASEIMKPGSTTSRVDAPDGASVPFVSALFDEVVLTVQAGREVGQGAKDLGNAVSRVYRVWRTDEAERRIRHLAGLSYHNGLLRGFAEAGVGTVTIDVHGNCETCNPKHGVELSTSDTGAVPIHDECRCTIVLG